MLHSGIQLQVGFGAQPVNGCRPKPCAQPKGPLGRLMQNVSRLLSQIFGGQSGRAGQCCTPHQNPCFGQRGPAAPQAQFGMSFSANLQSFLG